MLMSMAVILGGGYADATMQGGVWKGREEVASLRPKGKEFLREEGRGPIVEAQYKRYHGGTVALITMMIASGLR